MIEQGSTGSATKEFVVVARGPSAAVFEQGQSFGVDGFPSAPGPVDITCTTRYVSKGTDITVPGHLWIDVRGYAPSLDEALLPFANAGLIVIPVLALSANAAVHDSDIEIGFDNTAGVTERDFFQSYVAPETDELHLYRRINVDVTKALSEALYGHRDAERLLRGAEQYRMALASWRFGRESPALAHLWMAVEALTKAKVRAECEKRGVAKEADLASELDIELKELDSTIRRDFLLKGDTEVYTKAKEASDGFEHGFLSFEKIRELSRDVRHRMADYVRTVILELCNLDSSVYATLTSHPFDKPIGYWPADKYVRGKLVGPGDELAAPGNAYPFMKWNTSIKSIEPRENAVMNVEMTETLTADIAKGIQFRPQSFEARQVD